MTKRIIEIDLNNRLSQQIPIEILNKKFSIADLEFFISEFYKLLEAEIDLNEDINKYRLQVIKLKQELKLIEKKPTGNLSATVIMVSGSAAKYKTIFNDDIDKFIVFVKSKFKDDLSHVNIYSNGQFINKISF